MLGLVKLLMVAGPIILGAGLLFFIGAVLAYLLRAIALAKLASNNGNGDKAVIAYIPIVQFFLIAILGGDVKFSETSKVEAAHFGIAWVLAFLIGTAGGLGYVIFMLTMVMGYFGYSNVLRRLGVPKEELVTKGILSAIIPFYFTYFIFKNREKVFVE